MAFIVTKGIPLGLEVGFKAGKRWRLVLDRSVLNDPQWELIAPPCPGKMDDPGRSMGGQAEHRT